MKKKFLTTFILIFTIAMLLLWVGCKPNDTVEVPQKPQTPPTLNLNKMDMSLTMGESDKLVANYTIIEGNSLAFYSSDTEIVTVDNQGNLLAIKEGTSVITATYGDLSATCNIEVTDGGFVPSILFSGYDITNPKNQYIVGDEINLGSTIRFNNKYYTDAVFTYEVADTQMATVDATGVLKGLKIGSTTITVNASWRGKSDEIAPCVLNVAFKSNSYISINNGLQETVIYSMSEYEGNTFANTATLTVTAEDNNESVPYQLQVVEGNDLIAIEGNTVVGLRYGVAVVEASFTNSANEVVSNTIKIKVERPYKTVRERVLNVSLKDGVLSSDDIAFLFGEDETIIEVRNAKDETISENGKIVSLNADPSMAVQTIRFYNQTVGVEVGVKAYSDIITTLEEYLAIMPTYGNTNVKGCYLLGNDINCNGETLTKSSAASMFTGLLDGNGFSISNFKVSSSVGLFKVFGANSAVKNIAFINVIMANNSVLLTDAWLQQGQNVCFENIYIEVISLCENQADVSKRTFGILGNLSYQIKLDKFIVHYNCDIPEFSERQSFGLLYNFKVLDVTSYLEANDVYFVADGGNIALPLTYTYNGGKNNHVYYANNETGNKNFYKSDGIKEVVLLDVYRFNTLQEMLGNANFQKYNTLTAAKHWCFDELGFVYFGNYIDVNWQSANYSAKDKLQTVNNEKIISVKDLNGNEYFDGEAFVYANDTTSIIKKPFIVKTETREYYYIFDIYTDIITTFEELKSILPGTAEKDVAGAYILANDIDCNGEDLTLKKGSFTGLLDGNGHKITNFKCTTSNGIFHTIGDNTVIKNIAFTDFNAEKETGRLTILTKLWESQGDNVTFENIYLEINGITAKTFGVFGDNSYKFKLKNFIVNVQEITLEKDATDAYLGLLYAYPNKNLTSSLNENLSNVYIIADGNGKAIPLAYLASADSTKGNIYYAKNDTGLEEAYQNAANKLYCDTVYRFDAFANMLANESFKKYNEDTAVKHWCFDESGLVYFGEFTD